MATMPTACIALHDCITGCAYSSIGCFVTKDGNGNKSLLAIADCAGVARCMRAFQSLNNAISIAPATFTCTAAGGAATVYVCGPTWNCMSVSDNGFAWQCNITTPVSPCASPGRANTFCIAANAGACRNGGVWYYDGVDNSCTVQTHQAASTSNPVYLTEVFTDDNQPVYELWLECINATMSAGQCYCVCQCYHVAASGNKTCGVVCVYCNSVNFLCCGVPNGGNVNGTWSFTVRAGDSICMCARATTFLSPAYASACHCIVSITPIIGSFSRGTPYARCIEVYNGVLQ